MSSTDDDRHQRAVLVRTPFGWDCRMQDEVAGAEPEIGLTGTRPQRVLPPPVVPVEKPHRPARTAAIVLAVLAVLVAALLVPVGGRSMAGRILGGSGDAPQPTQAPAAVADPTTSPSAAPSPSDAPVATPVPAPTADPNAPVAPAPTPSAAAAPTDPAVSTQPATSAPLQLDGELFVSRTQTASTCRAGATGRGFCQWQITVPAGSTLSAHLAWTGGAPVLLRITSLDGGQVLFQQQGRGSVDGTVPSMPARSLMTVTLADLGRAQFQARLAAA